MHAMINFLLWMLAIYVLYYSDTSYPLETLHKGMILVVLHILTLPPCSVEPSSSIRISYPHVHFHPGHVSNQWFASHTRSLEFIPIHLYKLSPCISSIGCNVLCFILKTSFSFTCIIPHTHSHYFSYPTSSATCSFQYLIPTTPILDWFVVIVSDAYICVGRMSFLTPPVFFHTYSSFPCVHLKPRHLHKFAICCVSIVIRCYLYQWKMKAEFLLGNYSLSEICIVNHLEVRKATGKQS